MTQPTPIPSSTDVNSPAHKRKRESEEEKPTRLEELYVPLYKAYRKASLNLAKAKHHHLTLLEFKNQGKIPKAFKINIKPQIPNPTTEFIIDWETAASTFGHQLVVILVRYAIATKAITKDTTTKIWTKDHIAPIQLILDRSSSRDSRDGRKLTLKTLETRIIN